MTSQVLGSDFSGARTLPHYVNGRILTAEDLSTGQQTLRDADRWVARDAGAGVVNGLWVSAGGASISITAGLGVALSGDAVAVNGLVTLPLVLPGAAAAVACSFSCCAAPVDGSVGVSVGSYLLTAMPAQQAAGRSPMASPPGSSQSAGCSAQWETEGVAFKAIALPLPSTVMGVAVTDDNRRNLLAQWCFGSPQLATLGVDPFSGPFRWTGFDALSPTALTPADLPLAVFHWDGRTVGFVDNWSARRRVTAPDPSSVPWSALLSDRRLADGEARLLQFQDQAAALLDQGRAPTTVAAATFPFLPPVAYLPISTDLFRKQLRAFSALLTEPQRVTLRRLRVGRALGFDPQAGAGAQPAEAQAADMRLGLFARDRGTMAFGLSHLLGKDLDVVADQLATNPLRNGFDLDVFFGSVGQFGGVVGWETADVALRASWHQRPVAAAPPSEGEPARLTYFLVSENIDAGSLTGGAGGPPPYVVFVKNRIWNSLAQLPFTVDSQR